MLERLNSLELPDLISGAFNILIPEIELIPTVVRGLKDPSAQIMRLQVL